MGTGPFLARFFAQAGTEVVALCGTSPATVEAARTDLARQGIRAAGFQDVRALLAATRPDILAVASPAEAHDEALAAACEAGCHVLCEKPLVWGTDDVAQRAADHARAYQERGLHLRVSAQWPYTLDAFREVHPGVLSQGPTRFEMHLSPSRTGKVMIPDALPHVMSMLAAIAPSGDCHLEDIHVEVASDSNVDVSFVYVAGEHPIATHVTLSHAADQPRRAAYAIDGALVERKVENPGYRLVFETGGRRVLLADPLAALVRDFVRRVSSAAPPEPDPVAHPGTAHVATLAAAWPRAAQSGPPLA